MPDFDDLRGALAQAGDDRHRAERALFRARQQLARLKRGRDAAARGGDVAARAFDRAIRAAEKEAGDLKDRLAEVKQDERGRFEAFAAVSDPRKAIGRMSDRTPILLMPLRIETRFRQGAGQGGGAGGAQNGDALWVRVYPDDVAVDVFEDMLSESEALKTRSYWADVWRAGGREADLRAAWRGLLSGQGAGRSHWLTQVYRPLNMAEQPAPPAADDPTVILCIVTQAPLAGAERDAARAYWAALWKAGTDAAALTAAAEALALAVGDARAAEIAAAYRPRNLDDPPPEGADRVTTTAIVAFLDFPDDTAFPLRQSAWAQQPVTRVMPDRLVLMGWVDGALTLEVLGNPIPSPLAVGPDPSATPEDQLQPDGDDLKVDPEMEWVTDFARAVEVGMGFVVPLTPARFRRGFDRLMVLGLCARADAAAGAAQLQGLFLNHHRSRAGLSILPQGRPTNNVEGEGSGYSWQEDPDTSFDQFFGTPAPDPQGFLGRTDGRALAEALGLDPAALGILPFSRRTDIADARAMNVALWPATGGYFMDAMMDPVFQDRTVRRAREFFTGHVLARGPLPAIRIGKQPYGILPATARSRLGWIADLARQDGPAGADRDRGDLLFLQRLYEGLRKVEADTQPLLDKVSWVGKPGADRHQVLLDVVGLHAGSVEFQQRYAESFKELYNRMAMSGAGGAFVAMLINLGYVASGMQLLGRLGYQPGEGAALPDILEKLFLNEPNLLKGPLVDDVPLSETEPVRSTTAAGQNYLQWLAEAAGTSHEMLRLQKEFSEGTPTALLYLMLRHALDLSYVEVSRILMLDAGLLPQDRYLAERREPKFVGVEQAVLADPVAAGGSRWQYLVRDEPAITGTPGRTLGAHIPTVLTSMVATDYLWRQIEALKHLAERPTAALERVLAEHVDLFTYRLDAWYGGLMSVQLEAMRAPPPQEPGPVPGAAGTAAAPSGGIYLGAFGWLENLRPEFKTMTPVTLPEPLDKVFAPSEGLGLARDARNQGFIHAPSLNHAVTAAVLRNGYLSNATPDAPGSLAINLTSERVRLALAMIEGMQNQQGLGALLGYQFERGLHDRHDVEVDEFILDLRKAFPLVGDRLVPTRTGKTDSLGRKLQIRRVEARNVIDGLALVEHIKATGQKAYPFGKADLPAAAQDQADAISAEADRILNIADAVADLTMAESVHQVVQGNFERASGALASTSKGKVPQTPDVVRTPRAGVTLTHRVALHLKAGLDPADAALTSPRARAEPALNDWLAGLLPPMAKIAATVTVLGRDGAVLDSPVVTAADLGLLPVDLLHLLDTEDESRGRELDDRIEAHVLSGAAVPADAVIEIAYRDRIAALAGHVPFFEMGALIRPLRSLVLRSRPLRPTDMALSAEATDGVDQTQAVDPRRVTLVQAELAGHVAALEAFRAPLQARLDAAQDAQIATEIEATVAAFVGLMQPLAPHAAGKTGTAVVFGDRRRIFAGLRNALAAHIGRWDGRLAEFDQAILAYDADPGPDEERRIFTLRMAERLVSALRLDPLPPPDATAFRDHLVDTQRVAMAGQRAALQALLDSAMTVSALHDGIVAATAANAAFDPVGIDIAGPQAEIGTLAADLAGRAQALVTELTARLAQVQDQIDAHDAAADARARLEALTAAGRLMLGESLQLVPEFTLPPAVAQEWQAAWGGGATADGAILGHLTGTLGRRFPVDDWLTGLARVRARMADLEATEQLAGAFTGTSLPLQPLQFPHRPDTPRLGLDFPETRPDGTPFLIDEDKLLYTGHFVQTLQPVQPVTGLLLDEWTEVVPNRVQDTGLAFHYDRPNTEPPQVLLLAQPPRFTGAWAWADLVDTVIETMDLARRRAIEPDHLDTTAYARFLPAVISAVTVFPITAAMNLSFNNGLAAAMAAGEGGDE